MIESLILIEGKAVNPESLKSLSLGNAKQLVIGNSPMGIILHITATSPADLDKALLEIAQVSGVTKVVTLVLQKSN